MLALIVVMIGLVTAVAVARVHALGARALWRLALIWTPLAFYLWALWGLRSLFVYFARNGATFGDALNAAVSRTGWGLVLGGGATVLALPGVVAISSARTAGGFVVASLPALTICVVGVALIALAGLLRQAMALEAKAAAMKATLDEFV